MATGEKAVGSFRAAFGSWWAVIGILAGSITGFRLILRFIDIQVAQVTAYVLAQYHQFVHVPVWWLFNLMHWPRPTELGIDIMLLWMIVGAIVMRSAHTVRLIAQRNHSDVDTDRPCTNFLLNRRWTFPIFVLFSILLWPLMINVLLSEPQVYKFKEFNSNYIFTSRVRAAADNDAVRYMYDMRIVLIWQLVAALGAISLWVFWNALASMYAG